MFTEPTTFILGAGASWHYGYPTGADLIDQVLQKTKHSIYQSSVEGDWGNFSKTLFYKIAKLVEDRRPFYWDSYLESQIKQYFYEIIGLMNDKNNNLRFKLETINPTVIDFFLYENDTIQDIGRFNIASTILECDARELYLQYNKNRDQKTEHETKPLDVKRNLFRKEDDWYRFLIYKIVKECKTIDDLLKQKEKLKIITFNYDISLEKRLYSALMKIDIFDKKKDVQEKIEFQEKQNVIKEFISDIIIHVYGQISNIYEQRSYDSEVNNPENIAFNCADLEFLLDSYENLELISPKDISNKVRDNGEKCSKWLEQSKHNYILGFGFDEQNSKIIGLYNIFRSGGNSIYFTNFNNSDVINKRFEKLAVGERYMVLRDLFLNNGVQTHITIGNGTIFIEKSIKNVYEALEKDFDL